MAYLYTPDPLDLGQAVLLYAAAVPARVAPLRLLPSAVRFYFQPVHAEFASRTVWSLYNAVTETLKLLPPVPAFQSAARVGRFFETRLK